MRHLVALGAAISLFGAAAASADLVVFHNTGGMFEWESSDWQFKDYGDFLDITQGANQSGAFGPLGILYDEKSPVGSDDFGFDRLLGDFEHVHFAQRAPEPFPSEGHPIDTSISWAEIFAVGDAVGADSSYDYGAYLYAHVEYGLNELEGWAAGGLYPDHNIFVGIELTLDDGVHYGWIELRPEFGEFNGSPFWRRYYAESWGYETQAGVAAAVVPAPGGAAIIGCAVLTGLRRRR